MTVSDVEKLVKLAKTNKIVKMKVGEIEFEFTPLAYVELVSQNLGKSEAVDDEEMQYASAS
jgi:hypothetical protein